VFSFCILYRLLSLQCTMHNAPAMSPWTINDTVRYTLRPLPLTVQSPTATAHFTCTCTARTVQSPILTVCYGRLYHFLMFHIFKFYSSQILKPSKHKKHKTQTHYI
jgi:hypothetical protein